MDKAILLAVAASLCTATGSVCQRKGAKSSQTAGFDVRLVVRLACQPVWLLGIASMIGGFVFQLTALRFGGLALVQPVLAAELLFVFGYLAVAGSRRVQWRDWPRPPCRRGSACSSVSRRRLAGSRTHRAPPGWWPGSSSSAWCSRPCPSG
jgi:hypothetical protein